MSEPKSASSPKGESARGAVEVAARTVDEAIARGLVRLGGLSRTEVQIDVVREGRSGLLGFGAEEALVRLTPLGAGAAPRSDAETVSTAAARAGVRRVETPPAQVGPESSAEVDAAPTTPPADERRGRRRRRSQDDETPPMPEPARAVDDAPAKPSERSERPPVVGAMLDGEDSTAAAAVVATELIHQMGYADATIEIQESLLPDGEDDDIGSAVLCIRGRGTDRLLGDDAAALNALQFVTRLIVSRRANAWCNVLLDVDGDRRRRVKELLALANQSAELVESGGKPVSLPPMGAYERRVVHLALRDHPTVATQSIGAGTYRKVTVRGRDQMLPDL